MRRSRMLGWDHNSLRRRSDRVEAAMVAGLIAVFLICAPVLGVVAGHWIGSANIAATACRIGVAPGAGGHRASQRAGG